MIQKYVRDLMIFIATIDPFSTLSIFVAVTAGLSAERKRKIANRAILFATGVLVAAIAIGQVLLSAMHVTLPAFQIAGGIVLFLFGVKMVFGTAHSAGPSAESDLAVFPLATPTIAGPGAILAAIMLTDNDIYSFDIQIGSTFVLIGVLLINYLAMLGASFLSKFIGTGGTEILMRVMGLILTSLAVETVIHAILMINTHMPG